MKEDKFFFDAHDNPVPQHICWWIGNSLVFGLAIGDVSITFNSNDELKAFCTLLDLVRMDEGFLSQDRLIKNVRIYLDREDAGCRNFHFKTEQMDLCFNFKKKDILRWSEWLKGHIGKLSDPEKKFSEEVHSIFNPDFSLNDDGRQISWKAKTWIEEMLKEHADCNPREIAYICGSEFDIQATRQIIYLRRASERK